MKVIAYYLPQFHEIKENNEWWGNGFTEWTNIRKATELFSNHRQPRVPLNNNYYDLSNVNTLKWQADLARKYSIYGFCFYHYWFNGKLLLEKPAKILLDNKDIDIHFCFSWANETWARTWTGKNRDILIKQTYGNKIEWEKHFSYFIDYFKDPRYIKIDNKPMLLIYKSKDIPNIDRMFEYWNSMAIKKGFNGIYFVDTIRNGDEDKRTEYYQAHAEFEPARSINDCSKHTLYVRSARRIIVNTINKILKTKFLVNKIWKYDEIANKSLQYKNKKNTYGCVYMGWDNSPRKGTKAFIISEPSREEFKNYLMYKMKAVIRKNDKNNQIVFINAWNEWCEGTYLEPDTVNHYMYLETVKEVVEEINNYNI